jgi:murein DD-endopeptidase MepM/ murein hydrolase activator NlpD
MRKNIQASIVFLCLTVLLLYAQVEQKKLIAGVMKPIDYPKDILFDIDEEEDYPSSDLYESWQNEKVNPYKISIKDLPDSVLVDLSEYHHPTKNSVTSVFGPRGRRFHYGIDLRVAIG